jgi:ATP-dependent DNA helicase RecG
MADIEKLAAQGESETLEFKRSTGELREAMQTLCAFANGSGGIVLIGVRSDGKIIGQQVTEQTLHDIAAARDRFEPPIDVAIERIEVASGRAVLVLIVAGTSDSVPCACDGRAFERIGNTTRRMSQERFEALLLDRAHSRRRWENQIADEITFKDIDREEVSRIIEAARSTGRLVGPVGRSLPDLLDRLGVRRKGRLLRAAVVLFGKTFMPDYPQCELRMARFRGSDKTEFLDQRHIRGPAFKLLEEAEIFCQRHFPLPGRIEPGRLQRVDRPLIPPDAMREILVNALIHRDYSIAGGAVSLAIFDARVEVWSAGRFPAGITPESLTRAHPSVQRNPIIAEVFHRAGLIEKWGRGTNRVAEMCRATGIAPPEFAEISGAAVVVFRVDVLGSAGAYPQVTPQVTLHVAPQVAAILKAATTPSSAVELQRAAGLKDRVHFLREYLRPLLEKGWLERTIPDKPRSRNQRYRTTELGRQVAYGLGSKKEDEP